ncbi:hypothetical protein [Salinisphaera aquimarina]|uniref:Uncharacterized protein n=1 Tax=Salinisphaera aquimarina TaxID=2094031 RepID=A0ABV7EMZ3_9GAMM
MKFFFGLLIFAFLGWLAVRLLIKRLRIMRGDVIPEEKGPHTITIVCVGLVVIYALLILYRLSTEGFAALH